MLTDSVKDGCIKAKGTFSLGPHMECNCEGVPPEKDGWMITKYGTTVFKNLCRAASSPQPHATWIGIVVGCKLVLAIHVVDTS